MKKLFCLIISTLVLTSNTSFAKEGTKSIVFDSNTTTNQELYKNVEKIFDGVQKIRKLPAKNPVTVGVKTTEQVNKFLKDMMKKEYPDKDIKKDYLLLNKLGLLKAGTNIKDLFLNLYTEQIAGFYDESTKSLYVVDKNKLGELETSLIISHELVHSLQDQYYSVKKVVSSEKNGDKTLARTALIEGEATVASMQYLMESMGFNTSVLPNLADAFKNPLLKTMSPELDKAPGFIVEQMLFPYIEGANFVQKVYQELGSWDKFNDVYKRLPESTEQIMHPEKYLDNEKPINVDIKDFIKDKNWKVIDNDSLGEFFLLNYFLEYMSEKDAKVASEGWGGDKYLFFNKNDKENILVYKSEWDTQQDAKEFFEAFIKSLKQKYGKNITQIKKSNSKFEATTNNGNIYISLSKTKVNLAEGFPKTLEKKVKAYIK